MRSLVPRRIAQFSTSSAQDLSRRYPFPRVAHPTPHEIFHLPPGADQAAVKQRYFELVRIYHPDSATARGIPAQVAECQFKSITAAYSRLQNPLKDHTHHDIEYYREIQRRRAAHRSMGVRDFEFRQNATQAGAKAGGLWQRDEGLLLFFSLLAFFAAVYQLASPNPSQAAHKRHTETQKYLSEARSRGKEDGMRRRKEIRSWLRDRRDNQVEVVEPDEPPSSTHDQSGNIAGFGDAVSLRQASRNFGVYEHDRW